eukprot:5366733-Amphidinium_carterae.1
MQLLCDRAWHSCDDSSYEALCLAEPDASGYAFQDFCSVTSVVREGDHFVDHDVSEYDSLESCSFASSARGSICDIDEQALFACRFLEFCSVASIVRESFLCVEFDVLQYEFLDWCSVTDVVHECNLVLVEHEIIERALMERSTIAPVVIGTRHLRNETDFAASELSDRCSIASIVCGCSRPTCRTRFCDVDVRFASVSALRVSHVHITLGDSLLAHMDGTTCLSTSCYVARTDHAHNLLLPNSSAYGTRSWHTDENSCLDIHLGGAMSVDMCAPDPMAVRALQVVCVTWKRRRKERILASYNPVTSYNCLFMCLSKELCRLRGEDYSPQFLRQLVHDLWTSDQSVLGMTSTLWAEILGTSRSCFLEETLHHRRGNAPDAILLS